MARLRDIKVGQKIQIIKGRTSSESFNVYNADEFVGKECQVTDITTYGKTKYIKTDLKWGIEFPADWIKTIEDETEQSAKTEKTTKGKYAVLAAAGPRISDFFEDISQVFDVVKKWEGYDPHDLVELFEKGYYKIIEVKEIDVKIEIPKPTIKIVG